MARLMCQLSSPIDTLEAIFDFYLRDFKLSEAYTPINQHNTYNPLYSKNPPNNRRISVKFNLCFSIYLNQNLSDVPHLLIDVQCLNGDDTS